MKQTIGFSRSAVVLRRATAVAALCALGACGSTPHAPDQELQAAELAIANAEQSGMAGTAAPELGIARDRLTAARAAVNAEHMVVAQRLAEESRVNAELATARSDEQKAKAVNDEMRKGTETLKQEMQRNEGVRQ